MNKPSAKQERQRKLYLALGTVIGFHGYLKSLAEVVRIAEISAHESKILNWQLGSMRETLISTEATIRKAMRNL